MTTVRKSYRVQIWARGAAPPAEPAFTIPLGELASVPTIGGQAANPLRGRLVSSPYTLHILGDTLTGHFGTDSRPALLGRVIRLQVEETEL